MQPLGARRAIGGALGISVPSGAIWTPATATTDGGVSPHTWLVPGVANYQDSAKTTPATADDNPVGAVINQGSDSYDVLQATDEVRPTLKLSILNGQPVWRCDGGDFLAGTYAGGAMAQPFTPFVVAQLAPAAVNDDAYHLVLDGLNSANRMIVGQRSDPNPDDWVIYGGTAYVSGGASNANWNIWTILFNGASSQFWHNGVSKGTGNPGSHTPTGITVASRYTGALWWIGDIAEVLIYPGNISTADKNQVGAYFNAKFGISYTNIV